MGWGGRGRQVLKVCSDTMTGAPTGSRAPLVIDLLELFAAVAGEREYQTSRYKLMGSAVLSSYMLTDALFHPIS